MAAPKFPLEVEIKGIDKVSSVLQGVQSRIDKVAEPVRRLRANFIKLSESSGLTKLTGAMRGVGSAVGGVISKVSGLALKLGGLAAAGAAGAFALVRSFATAGDQVAKTADKLGVGIEALQELRFAADRSGIGVQTFDMAMQRAGRRVAEAAQGTGEAVKALEELGVSAVDAEGKARGIEDLLPELADKFAALEGPTDRMRLAMKLFDSEGVALVNMLGLGAEGVEALRREARELGLVMSERAARGSEVFVDAQTNLAAALTGVKNVVASALMPTMQGFLEQLTELVVARRADIQRFAEAFVERLPAYLEQLREGFRRLLAGLQPVISAGQALVERFGAFRVILAAIGAALGATLLPSLVVASKAFYALGAAILTTPIGWILGGIAAVAAAFYHWDEISAWWNGLWQGIWSDLGDWIDRMGKMIAEWIDGVLGWIGDLFGFGGQELEVRATQVAPQGSDLRAAAGPGAGAPLNASRNENVVRVRFDQVPRGVTVDPERTEGDFELDVGYQLAGA